MSTETITPLVGTFCECWSSRLRLEHQAQLRHLLWMIKYVLIKTLQFHACFVFFFRASFGVDRVCALWGSTGLPEEEPWIK